MFCPIFFSAATLQFLYHIMCMCVIEFSVEISILKPYRRYMENRQKKFKL